MRVLLVSTYELGHQPLHLASPAAALRIAGHEVAVLDTSLEPPSVSDLAGYDAVAVSVPMHTAGRLAYEVVAAVRSVDRDVPIALYGLYAGEGEADGVTARFVGEYEPMLVEWLGRGAPTEATRISVANGHFVKPARDLLADLSRYSRLQVDGEERIAAYVEASHGCRHRCRHCPIPAVYDGRYRIVAGDVVLADVEAQVSAGARHVTWGDPDFLNGPRHAVTLLEEVHRRHPELTHDLTIKVEHLRAHEDLLGRLASAGTIFVVSAFETTDDRTLALLDKGHTAEDMAWAVERTRAHGIDIRPSWMPFVPWTAPDHVAGIFEFIAAHDLLGTTDPVQLSIRLLIPRGSLMMEIGEVTRAVGDYDSELLSYRWESLDPRSDELQLQLAQRAENAAAAGEDPVDTLIAMWGDVIDACGRDRREIVVPGDISRERPRLTESWFCCAEPTQSQTATLAFKP